MTSIPDSDSNADYAFGYADVTPVPSVKDGTPVNPYTPYTSDKDGGDGFDLAWAVEIGGTTPVKIDNAKYVRIYSAVLYNTGIFGETSPEITGIFRTNSNTVGSGEYTATPSVTIGGNTVTLSKTAGEMSTVTISKNTATDVVVTAGADHVIYMNNVTDTGTATETVTLARGKSTVMRVIVKDSTDGLPYIGYVKINAK